MTEREKVVRGLEVVRDAIVDGYIHEPDRAVNAITDAISMLKEQEPVEPVVDIDTWKCGKCGHTLEHQELLDDNVLFNELYSYCPNCGRQVKWGKKK